MTLSRRKFLKTAAATSALGLWQTPFNSLQALHLKYISGRPPVHMRRFTSQSVEALIRETCASIADSELALMFENCYPNTLDTTVDHIVDHGNADTFIITGDIDAMWLRDSTAQIWPYLSLIEEDHGLRILVEGLIRRQIKCILIDPYANAFNKDETGSQWDTDMTEMQPALHERKWEIDSLCYPIRLAYQYWKSTGDLSIFDSTWKQAMRLIVATFREQQRKTDIGPYSFMRKTNKQEDTLPLWGSGNPVKPVGMICSMFRPSDDATMLPFLIPSNLFAVKSLHQLSVLWEKIGGDRAFASECRSLADEVLYAIQTHAIVEHPECGLMYAYEVDGFGGRILMDDANIPSLLSLPYLGLCRRDDEIYQNTRRFVLSEHNPYFFKGSAGEGIGGPHVGLDYIWPMSIIMRGLTADNADEVRQCLSALKKTHAGTGFMHESFHKNDATIYTRKWFAWANTLFGEFILDVADRFPEILCIASI
ncbi:glycoside hydrolase family 125 protein [bacterium]|nr:glycoside hydrolase family 125 protein [bacterium]